MEAVSKYIQKHQLLSQHSTVIVGFSGGADSVALLHFLHQSGYICIAAHCNFHLRQEESLRDEAFARSFAAQFAIPFEKIDFDTNEYASRYKVSVEMAARDLRYEWFEKLRSKYQAETIAVAHHKDDSIETVLLNLVRGTGIRGLTGIKPKSGHVVRPLLCVNKEEILRYISDNGLEYVTDSSNLQDQYTRNKIRLQVLPLLKTINPSVEDAIQRTAENLFQTEQVYTATIEQEKEQVMTHHQGIATVDIEKILQSPSPEALIYKILTAYDFNNTVIEEVQQALDAQSGKMFYSPTHRLVKDRKDLIITPIKTSSSEVLYQGVITPATASLIEPVHMEISCHENTPDFQFRQSKQIAYFDKDKLQFPLSLRKWQKQDAFVPFGMKGKQKISKYFKDHKFSQVQKENTWLLCSGNDIIWIVGERADDRFRVDADSRVVYMISVRF